MQRDPNGGSSILAQLSGLRLSDGTSAGERVRVQGTPPSLEKKPSDAAFGAAPSSSSSPKTVSSAARAADISRLLSSVGVRVNSPPPQSSAPSAANGSPKDKDSGSSKAKEKARKEKDDRDEKREKGKDAKVMELPKPRSELRGNRQPATAGIANMSSNSNSNSNSAAAAAGRGSSSGTAAAATAAPPAAAAAPPAAAAAAAAAGPSSSPTAVDRSVMDFFSKHSAAAGGPAVVLPPGATAPSAAAAAAAPKPSSKATVTATSTNKTTVSSPVSSTSGPTPAERRAAQRASQFLIDAFGSIDNTDASRPIVRTLPKVPAGGRYIVVGDVHGCVDELEALIEKVKYVKGTDCLVIIGDYVNKGPDSVGVVRSCMRHGALGVLGNHDFTLLKCIELQRRRPFQPEDLKDPVKHLAREFPLECEYYLRSLPHILKMPEYNVVLVHAGLNVQHRQLEDQNVYEIMHLRRLERLVTVDPQHHKKEVVKYQAVIKGRAGVPWGEVWEGPERIIFGHDAYSGFQNHPHATGIDTGCVYGDPLTAVVFSAAAPQGEFLDVPGLPKRANELKGLPPPDAAIYEQLQVELERQIIRPTPRATPSLAGSPISGRPVFLTTPVSQGSPVSLSRQQQHAGAPATPSSLFPSMKAMTPVSAAAVRLEMADVGARDVQKRTLLALAAAGELSALAVVLAMPVYETALETMQEADASDKMAVDSFWAPFARNVLEATAAAALATSGAELSHDAEEPLSFVLGVCDEMEAVRAAVQAELKALQAPAIDAKLSRATRKYLSLLIR